MSKVTYYVVLPFNKSDEGLFAEEAAEAPNAAATTRVQSFLNVAGAY